MRATWCGAAVLSGVMFPELYGVTTERKFLWKSQQSAWRTFTQIRLCSFSVLALFHDSSEAENHHESTPLLPCCMRDSVYGSSKDLFRTHDLKISVEEGQAMAK